MSNKQAISLYPHRPVGINYWKNLCVWLVILASLSILLEWISLYFGYKRYAISVEMLLAFFLSSLGFFWLGLLVFSLAISVEIVLGVSSVLFLFDYDQVKTIVGFIFEAKFEFIVALIIAINFAVALYLMANRLLRRIEWQRTAIVSTFIILLQVVFSFRDGNFAYPHLSERSKLIAGSAFYFSKIIMLENGKVFNLRSQDNVEYIPVVNPSAVMQTFEKELQAQGLSNKVLLIVAESWGLPTVSKIFESQVDSLIHNKNITNIEFGEVKARGATAFGEFRELCGKVPTKLNLKKISQSDLGSCFPKRLKEAGYQTISIHGAHGTMYDRLNWYPVLGIDSMIFREILPMAKDGDCFSFPGYCDKNIFPVVREKLIENNKIFLYWLTLNSHMPYDKRDIINYQDGLCASIFQNGYDERLCNYHLLQKQFFDGLSALAGDKLLSGTEVLVVGDHPPPLLTNSEPKKYFESESIPFLHFHIK
ncbi:MAG: sulfatase-like hydrolase/transferase [Burkholderiaceae bacterium]|jgi:phosphoglycerol transferase MdoB-like AlkP superfamily enzyme|nr:sulfatase-like hydrolase/transferase [Burkholderiaceae bacterium]